MTYVEIELRFKAIRRFKIDRIGGADLPHPMRFQKYFTEVVVGWVMPANDPSDTVHLREMLDELAVKDQVADNFLLWDKLKANAIRAFEALQVTGTTERRLCRVKNTVGQLHIDRITEPYYLSERKRIGDKHYE